MKFDVLGWAAHDMCVCGYIYTHTQMWLLNM